jgi:hypothetical protein
MFDCLLGELSYRYLVQRCLYIRSIVLQRTSRLNSDLDIEFASLCLL